MPLQETTLTDETIEKICTHLRRHAFRETAIACAGVNRCTVREWIRKGVRDQRDGVESIFRRLADKMDEAEREAEEELIGGITKRGLEPFLRATSSSSGKGGESQSEAYEPPDWKALAWIAERRGAKRWGIKKHVTVAIEQDREKLLDAVEKTLGPDALIKLSEALAAQDADAADAATCGETEGED